MLENTYIRRSCYNELISVIIPSYNSSKYILKAIESVLNQTYKHIELIIVDDGSSDDTKEVLAKYSDKIIYYYQENRGPAAARNIGVSLSSGYYVAFLDADDYWDITKLEKSINIFNNSKDVGIVCCNLKYIDSNGNVIHLRRVGDLSSEQIKSKMYLTSLISPVTAVFKKNIFIEVGGFDQNLRYAEDWDLFFKMTRLCEIHAIDEYLSYYVVHSNSMMRSLESRDRLLEDTVVVIKRMYFDTDGCYDKKKSDESVMNYYINLTDLCISEGNSKFAIKLSIMLLSKKILKVKYITLFIKSVLCNTIVFKFLRYIKVRLQ